ncbi:MAG: hypothetical protein EAZ97_08320 [Bacteroidetes bacterium]|nr:MAG: hypothetical protein EAZ97_08320 [Bacteroidota bacterium]
MNFVEKENEVKSIVSKMTNEQRNTELDRLSRLNPNKGELSELETQLRFVELKTIINEQGLYEDHLAGRVLQFLTYNISNQFVDEKKFKEREIYYEEIFLKNLFNWLIDLDSTDPNNVNAFPIKAEITNLHTLTNEVFETIGNILGMNTTDIEVLKGNKNDRIEGRVFISLKKIFETLEQKLTRTAGITGIRGIELCRIDDSIIAPLFKLKAAVNYAKEFLNLKESLNEDTFFTIKGTEYKVDFMFLAHVLLGHTCYFRTKTKTKKNKNKKNKKSIFNISDSLAGQEHRELDEIYTILQKVVEKIRVDNIQLKKNNYGKVYVEKQRYRLGISNNRLVTFFPEGNTGKVCPTT